MHPFEFYLKLGFEHIANLNGYDHILFLIALCAIYRIEQWKKILFLVTAFTVGHSITLFLVSFDFFSIPTRIIKGLIPLTIVITALNNVIGKNQSDQNLGVGRNYLLALFFGLIHGMDFSNYFKALIMSADEIIVPLFGFNVGIELGQLLIVFFIIGIAFIFLNLLGVKQREWNIFISGAAFGISILSIIELYLGN